MNAAVKTLGAWQLSLRAGVRQKVQSHPFATHSHGFRGVAITGNPSAPGPVPPATGDAKTAQDCHTRGNHLTQARFAAALGA